jgi:hypothetical protein
MATMLVLFPGNPLKPYLRTRVPRPTRPPRGNQGRGPRDRSTVGVILEGWAFDPARSGRDALATVASHGSTRGLAPLAESPSHPRRTTTAQGGPERRSP